MRVRMFLTLLAIGALFLVAACAEEDPADSDDDTAADEPSDDTDDSDGDGEGEEDGDDGEDMQAGVDQPALERMPEVLAEVEGLEGQERFDALLALAQEEDGQLNIYTSQQDHAILYELFEERTGISIGSYAAVSTTVLQRVFQEFSAGFPGADVVQVAERDMRALSSEGVLTPIETPAADGILPEAVFDDWIGSSLSVTTGCWNTNSIPTDEAPRDWHEALTETDANWTFEVRQFEWFRAVVEFLMDEHGYSEDEAVDLFRDVVENASGVRGSDTIAQLIAAGEYDIGGGTITYICNRPLSDGAPIEFIPMIEPAVARPNGPGILSTTERPATALLWLEFILSEEVQEIKGTELGRTPARQGAPGGVPEGTLVRVFETEEWDDAAVEKWEGLYNDVMRGITELHE